MAWRASGRSAASREAPEELRPLSQRPPGDSSAAWPGERISPRISRPSRAMPPSDPSPLARALGRIPSGLYIVSTLRAGAPVGFVGSLVQQVGFAPPIVSLAVAKEREPLRDLRACGRFSLSMLDAGTRSRMGVFLKHAAAGHSPYDGLALGR